MAVTCFLCGCSDKLEIIRPSSDLKGLKELYCKRCDVFTPITVAVASVR